MGGGVNDYHGWAAVPDGAFPVMDDEMDGALKEANDLSGNPPERGMAEVGVTYNAYRAKWTAEATWSDGHKVEADADDASVAVAMLREKLVAALAEIKGGA